VIAGDSSVFKQALILLIYLILVPQFSMGSTEHKNQKKNAYIDTPYKLSVTNGLVSLDAQDAVLEEILAEISNIAGIKVKLVSPIEKSITISFKDLPLDDALKKLAPNYAIAYKKLGNRDEYKVSEVVITDSQKRIFSLKKDDPAQKSVPLSTPTHINTVHKTIQPSILNPGLSGSLSNNTVNICSRYVQNELAIRFNKYLSNTQIQAAIAELGASVKNIIPALNYYIITLPSNLSVNSALIHFQNHQGVDAVEPNYLIPLKTVPDDPEFPKQWPLNNTGQTNGTDDADVDAPEAWDIETGSSNVVIAIVDTGIDYTHEDLCANIWNNTGEIAGNGVDDDGNGYIDDTMGWDFVDASGGATDEDFVAPDNDPMDRHGHGTHVAGIAGAVADNGTGIAGVAGNCKIMPVRAGYKTSSGDGVLESVDSAQAIIYAAENGAKVINLSWGDPQKSNLIDDAIAFANDQGALICAAAGNENTSDILYPAASENTAVMAVGATDANDRKATFSNYGSWVDVSAPGVSIYSLYLNNRYQYMSGTSMATPHVAGLAALLFSYFEDISPVDVKARIIRSVDVLSDLSEKNCTSGRIDAYTALTANYVLPYIFTLNPESAHQGDQITISGDNFGDNQGSGRVRFYPETEADIISWTSSVIVCQVPDDAQSGEVNVVNADGRSNSVTISILVNYYEETLIENDFIGAGEAQTWQADDQAWEYQLPFTFTFFGQAYDRVYVCANGYLDFTDPTASYLNSDEAFKTRVMIAPLWDDLVTNGSAQTGEDIYVEVSDADAVSFRWVAETYENGNPVNAEAVLYSDGRIQFNYAGGNGDLSPTIGISGGGGENYHFSTHDGTSQLTQAESAVFSPVEQTFTIELDLGWNLISLPIEPSDNQVSQVIGSITEGIESVWGYMDGKWQVYIPDNESMSDLEVMESGRGYWIKTKEAGLSIKMVGELKTDSINLTQGWNLVGICLLYNIPVEDALSSFGQEYITIWGYKDGTWQFFDSQSSGFNNLEIVEPGKGYWLYFP